MPENDKIITTIAVLENPSLTASETTDVITYSKAQRKRDVDRYWKDVDEQSEKRRKIFPTEFWELDALIKKTGQIAFVVKNINNPNQVTAKWQSFSPEKPPALKENDRCFVLKQPFYNRSIVDLTIGIETRSVFGLARIQQNKMSSNFIVALLGKDKDGTFNVYFQNAKASLIEKDADEGFTPAPGGEGAGGVKLPA